LEILGIINIKITGKFPSIWKLIIPFFKTRTQV
jgi:hypothetical protein